MGKEKASRMDDKTVVHVNCYMLMCKEPVR